MSNPATFLLEFFRTDAKEQHGVPFHPLYDATVRLQADLIAVGKAGANVTPFEELPALSRRALRMQVSDDLARISTQRGPSYSACSLDSSDLRLLELASERIQVEDFRSKATEKNVRNLLSAVQALIAEDESLDVHLRLFIAQAVLAVQSELDNFSITGDFRLRDALLRLFGLLRTAEATSAESGKWKDTWEKWGVPVTQGLIVSIPQVALGVGAILAAIGQ